MKKYKNSAFTLVELIVVITILAILGTIAFISLQGYSLQSRDSVRITDISSMKTSLELFQLDAGKYPEPTNGVDITYSGSAVVWTQGTFGESTFKNVESLDKIPTDPLNNKEYTYLLLNTNIKYQLGGVLEGGEVVKSMDILNETYAANRFTAYIDGTYNGIFAKVNTVAGPIYVLSPPSIITIDTSETTIEGIVANQKFSYNGTENLPSSFALSALSGSFDFNSGTPNNILIYEGTIKELSGSGGLQLSFIEKLQTAYSGTSLANVDGIKNILDIDLNDSNEVNLFSSSLINNNLGGNVILSSNSGNGSDGGVTFKSISDCDTSIEVIYGTVDGTDSGLSCDNDIIVCNGASGSGYVLASCNAGANTIFSNQVFTGATSPRDSLVNDWAGGLYQWGNIADNSYSSINFTSVNTTTTSEDSTYDSQPFIRGNSSFGHDWLEVHNSNLWGEDTDTNGARIGPCEIGYHIPKTTEWSGLMTTLGWCVGGCGSDNDLGLNMVNHLKIAMLGKRNNDGDIIEQGTKGYYWSSSPHIDGVNAYNLNFNSNNIYSTSGYNRSSAFSVRCFKN